MQRPPWGLRVAVTCGILPAMTPHNPLHAAAQINAMASQAKSDKLAAFFTGLSGALLLLMLAHEAKDLLGIREKSWRERVREEGRDGRHR
jgi:hypothetical protein